MPRQKRLEIPDGIYHVIIRGINQAAIFRDRFDRKDFQNRLAKGLEKTGCQCYAWSLMINHVHLLLSPKQGCIGDLMKRVLTGYAIYFNHKYKRCGYLFQNRYKSILCQKDAYFLELIRYIHLNPVRAGIVSSVEELEKYLWTGHSYLIGKMKNNWQSNEGLTFFHTKKITAIKLYREFIKSGWAMGKRDDLNGGGLKRSAGGWSEIIKTKKAKQYWRGDERILGESDFVNEVIKAGEQKISKNEKLKKSGWNIERLAKEVCRQYSIKTAEIKKRGRSNKRSQARSLFAYWGYEVLGFKGKELADYLGISGSTVTESIERGREFAKAKILSEYPKT